MPSNKLYYPPHKSSIGPSDAKYIALIAYVGPIVIGWIPEYGTILSWILPLVFLLMEKESLLVRYSAAQSLVLSAVVAVANIVLAISAIVIGILTLGIGAILSAVLLLIVNIVGWVLLAYAAYLAFSQWCAYEMPLISPLAHKLERAIGKKG